MITIYVICALSLTLLLIVGATLFVAINNLKKPDWPKPLV